ncbi:hypothetical protein, partial [Undibacterium squillarum]|uniref:hypothetical protein n=1 Tax=Undibacterium squillarum TaxID=1131567 RepID=UPI0035B1DCE7
SLGLRKIEMTKFAQMSEPTAVLRFLAATRYHSQSVHCNAPYEVWDTPYGLGGCMDCTAVASVPRAARSVQAAQRPQGFVEGPDKNTLGYAVQGGFSPCTAYRLGVRFGCFPAAKQHGDMPPAAGKTVYYRFSRFNSIKSPA